MTDDKTYQPLALNVPEPGCRPGDTPDFSYFEVPRAGAVARPAVDVDPDDMREMAFSIVRVLNKEGEAVGDWAGALTPEELREGLRDMMLLRRLTPGCRTRSVRAKPASTCSISEKRP